MAKGPRRFVSIPMPVNGTFHSFRALNVVKLAVLEGREINRGKFDHLVESYCGNGRSDTIVTAGPAPLCRYGTT